MFNCIINQITLLIVFFVCIWHTTDVSTRAILLMLLAGFSVIVASIENLKNDKKED